MKSSYDYRFRSVNKELEKLKSEGMTDEQLEKLEPLIREQVNSDDRFYRHNYISSFKEDAITLRQHHLIRIGERRDSPDSDWQGVEYRHVRLIWNPKPDSWREGLPARGCIEDLEVLEIYESLSERKAVILDLLIKGVSGKDIAAFLGITPPAVTKAKKVIANAFLDYAIKMHYLKA